MGEQGERHHHEDQLGVSVLNPGCWREAEVEVDEKEVEECVMLCQEHQTDAEFVTAEKTKNKKPKEFCRILF